MSGGKTEAFTGGEYLPSRTQGIGTPTARRGGGDLKGPASRSLIRTELVGKKSKISIPKGNKTKSLKELVHHIKKGAKKPGGLCKEMSSS